MAVQSEENGRIDPTFPPPDSTYVCGQLDNWPHMRSDAELFALALAGGPEAFAPVVERYQDAVFGVALARLRNFHEAEDVAQEVFVTAFERLGGLKDPTRLGAWLRSVTIHHSIDRIRRRDKATPVEAGQVRTANVERPDVELERQELRDQVMAAVGRLSKTQRETTTLFYVNGYSIADVAAIQEVPAGTVKCRLHDARAKLKEDMIGMVEDVLKSESPKDRFGRQVFDILNRHQKPRFLPWSEWTELVAEIERIGSLAIEGFVEALRSPHSPTRALAVNTLDSCKAPETKERVIALLKGALKDPNKKVRRIAMRAIMSVDVERERRVREFVPLAAELLTDRSNRVRRLAASRLHNYAKYLPLEQVVRGYVMDLSRLGRATTMGPLLQAALDPDSAPVYDESWW